MKIDKVINNNVVSAFDDNNVEVVIMGKGIGFQKKSGACVPEDKIEKIFRLPKDEKGNFEELIQNMPYEHIRIADKAIAYASEKLHKELNRNIYITLTDHLNFAIERYKKDIQIHNALLWEISKYYATEYSIGKEIINMVNNELGINLPDDEAGFIALHIVNAEMEGHSHMAEIQKVPLIIKDILNIIKYTYNEEVIEGTLAYERFLTHIKFFIQRLMNDELYDEVDDEFYELIKRKHPKAFMCAKKIEAYMKETKGYSISDSELLYLTIHIERITKSKYIAKNKYNESYDSGLLR